MISGKLSEELAVVGVADPIVLEDTAKYTDYIDMSKFEQVLLVFAAGDVSAHTFDVKVREAKDGSGTDEQDLSGKAITQWAAHATNNDNDQAVICVRREDLTDGFTHIRGQMVSQSGQTGPVALIALGGNAAYNPASDNDLATVREIV